MLIAMIEMGIFIVNVLLDLKVMVKSALILMNALKVQAIEVAPKAVTTRIHLLMSAQVGVSNCTQPYVIYALIGQHQF